MKKHFFTAVLAACAITLSLCSCKEKSSSDKKASSQPMTAAYRDDSASYDNGTYSGKGFSLYAEPKIWAFRSKDDDSCDLRMITDRDFTTCGISVYISNDDHGGKTAQEIVEEASKNENIVFSGPLATSAFTFYFYEWAVDGTTHARTYFADYGDKYLCIYAESSNFGYVDVKIADLLSTLKMTDDPQNK